MFVDVRHGQEIVQLTVPLGRFDVTGAGQPQQDFVFHVRSGHALELPDHFGRVFDGVRLAFSHHPDLGAAWKIDVAVTVERHLRQKLHEGTGGDVFGGAVLRFGGAWNNS